MCGVLGQPFREYVCWCNHASRRNPKAAPPLRPPIPPPLPSVPPFSLGSGTQSPKRVRAPLRLLSTSLHFSVPSLQPHPPLSPPHPQGSYRKLRDCLVPWALAALSGQYTCMLTWQADKQVAGWACVWGGAVCVRVRMCVCTCAKMCGGRVCVG